MRDRATGPNRTRAENDATFGFQSSREESFPTLVQLALMHYICNSSCLKCPVGLLKRGLVEPKGEYEPARRRFFPFVLFPRVAEEMGKHPWSILRFHGRGEPLMHPHYTEMIAMAKSRGVGTVTSFTNAVLLDEEMAEKILDARIDLLEMSVDASSEEMYRHFRGTEHFGRVVTNVERFIVARNRRGKECKTRAIVSAVDCPEFAPEKGSFNDFWSRRADHVIFRPYHTYGGRLDAIPSAECQPETVPCAQLWTRFSINPWGQVNACFNDWADRELVGDLNEPEASIEGIWRNELFEKIRKESLDHSSTLSCCKSCLATRSGWTESYQKLIGKLQTSEPNFGLGK